VVDEPQQQELLQFPMPWPIKVVGRRAEMQRADIDAIVRLFAPDLTEEQISERESNQKHFLSVTYTINAQSKEQVVGLANALKAATGVIMLI
jgi:uncharacterized protein